MDQVWYNPSIVAYAWSNVAVTPRGSQAFIFPFYYKSTISALLLIVLFISNQPYMTSVYSFYYFFMDSAWLLLTQSIHARRPIYDFNMKLFSEMQLSADVLIYSDF